MAQRDKLAQGTFKGGGLSMLNVGDRDLLEILRDELAFVEQGGYTFPVRKPWRAPSIFEDSPTCINFNDPRHPCPCEECPLIRFVPLERRQELVPCHHIPLNEAGDSVDSVERWGDQKELEELLKEWLRRTIKQLEAELDKRSS